MGGPARVGLPEDIAMNIPPRALVLAVFCLVAAGPAAQAPAPAAFPRASADSVGLDAARLQDAAALLKFFVEEHRIAGAVAAVARNGRLAWLEAAGVQDIAAKTPMTERSLFRIYSMTKPVTAVAAMMLLEEGRFNLNDPVSKYIPEFDRVVVRTSADGVATRPPARPITVEDLMLHTSGLSHRFDAVYRTAKVRSRAITLPQFITNIVRVPLMEDPGTRFRYSEGTSVLGRLVEIWSGKPLDAFFEERIFRPLGMVDTTFVVRPSAVPRLTTVYSSAPANSGGLTPVEIEEVPFTTEPALFEGAVGLVSTVPDYLRFAQMLLDRGEFNGVRVLRAATVDRMVANGLPDTIMATRKGVGWGLANVQVQPTGEYGWDGTAGTIFWVDPAKKRAAILMTQSSPANPGQIRQQFKALIDQATID
jgi:CubicO group peptidase (beta-lactamase class C family)